MKSLTKKIERQGTRAKGEQTRRRLAESAFTLFSQMSVDAVTLDMISENASVTKGALYCHYNSKKELLLEACRCYYRKWEQLVVGYSQLGETPVDQLRKAILSSAELCLFDAKNRFFTAQLFALALTDADVKLSWETFYIRARDFYTDLLEKISQQKLAEISSPRQNANRLLSIMEGIKQQAFLDAEICVPSRLGEVVDFLMQIALG